MMVEVITVRQRAVVVKEHGVLLAFLDIAEISVMDGLTYFHLAGSTSIGFANTAREVDGIPLDHLEVGGADKGIGSEHDVKVRVARNGQPFIGLVTVVMPEIAQIDVVAADDVERWNISFLKGFVTGGEDQGIDTP